MKTSFEDDEAVSPWWLAWLLLAPFALILVVSKIAKFIWATTTAAQAWMALAITWSDGVSVAILVPHKLHGAKQVSGMPNAPSTGP